MLLNILRITELALRFPTTRKVTYHAAAQTSKLVITTYNDFMDDVAWEIARNRYIKEQTEQDKNE